MSHLGSLSRCIMEGDPDSRTRAKWLRGKSLAISVAIEGAVLVALLLAPLLAPGVLPPIFEITPAVPYRGLTRSQAGHPPSTGVRTQATPLVFHPSTEHPVIRQATSQNTEAPPSVGEASGPFGAGPGIFGGGNHGTAINLAPPATPPRTKPLRQSEGVMAARLIRRVHPDYPRIAKLMRLTGTVRLSAIVGADGTVQQLEVLSGNPILARAAVDAVRKWRYEPTRLNGEPVEVVTNITVTFILN